MALRGRRRILRNGTLLGAFSIAVMAAYWWYRGFQPRQVGDAEGKPEICASMAADLTTLFEPGNVLYSTFLAPHCLVYQVAGVQAWIVIQIVLWASIVVLIYRTTALLFDEQTGIFAGIALAILWETFRFAIWPTADLVLLFILALLFWVLARSVVTGVSHFLVVCVLLVLLTLARPLGFPIALGWIGWYVLRPGREEGVSLSRRHILVVSIIAAALAIIVAVSFVLPRLDIAHTDPSVYWRRSFTAKWANGIVVTHPGTPTFEYMFEPRSASNMLTWLVINIDHLVSMAFLKMAFFFVPVLPRWSTFHIVINLVTLLPLLVGTAAGTIQILKRRRYDLAGLLLTPIVMSLAIVAFAFLDGGFTYRAPASLSFVLVSAYFVHTNLRSGKWRQAITDRFPRRSKEK